MANKFRAAPRRRCLASADRESKDKSGLLRWRIGADNGKLEFDPAHKLSGRGFYLSPNREIIALALRKNLFARAARRNVVLPRDATEFVSDIVKGLELYALTMLRAAKRGRILRVYDGKMQFSQIAAELNESKEPKEKVKFFINCYDAAQENKEFAAANDESKDNVTYLLPIQLESPNGQGQDLRSQIRLIAASQSLPNAVVMRISLPNPAQGLAARLQIVLEQLKCLRT